MSDSWASTDDHAPQAASAASGGNSGGWQSTDDHAPAAGFTGGTQRPNVSRGASDEDIIRSFGYDPKALANSPLYQQIKAKGGKLSDLFTDPKTTNESWSDAAAHGNLTRRLSNSWVGDLGQGAMDLIEGAGQFGRHLFSKVGLADDRDTPLWDLFTKIQQQDYQQNIRHGNAHPLVRLAGNVVAGSAIPGVEAPPGASLGARVATGAVNGAIAGGTQPVNVPPSGDYWGTKGLQVGTGAVAGAGTTAAVSGVARGAAKITSKIQNAKSVQLPEQVSAAADQANTAAEQSLEATSQASGQANTGAEQLSAAASQAAQRQGNAIVTRAETAAADARQTAQTEAQKSLEKLRGGIADTPRNIDDLTAAATSGDRHAAMVHEQVLNAGDDPARLYESGIALQNWRTGQQANQMYNQVDALAQAHRLGPVPLSSTGLTISRIEAQAKVGMQDRGLNRTLSDIRAAIAQPDYGTTRKVISQLDEIIRTGRTGDNALVTDRGIAQLQQVKNSLENDASQFVNNSGVPELQQAQQAADSYYRQARVPFKDINVAKAGTTDEPDTIFKKFIMAGRGDRAQKFYDALDAKGQSAVQYEIVADAFNKATDQTTGNFSPKAFFNALDKVGEARGVFFQGRDAMVIDGLKKLMTTAIDRDASVAEAKALADASQKQAAQVGKFNIDATKQAGQDQIAQGKLNVQETKQAGKQSVDAITARVKAMDKYPLGAAAASGLAFAEAFRMLGMPAPAVISGSIGGIAGALKALMMTDGGRRFLMTSSAPSAGSQMLVSRIEDLLSGKVAGRLASGAIQ